MNAFRWAGVILLLIATPLAAADRRPNVLFIIADDLRTELNCYGVSAVKSPHIDRLSARGRQFDFAYCQYPVCNPSRASFLTGLRPDATQVLSNNVPFRSKMPDVTTLPRHFKNNGYFTAGLGKVFHLGGGPRNSIDDPASYDELTHFDATPLGTKGEGRNLTGGRIAWCRWLAADGADEDQPDGQIAARAIALMEKHRDGPFFIATGFQKPHDPFIAPQKYFDLYPLGSAAVAPVTDPADATPVLSQSISGGWKDEFAKFGDGEKREFKRAYYAGTSFVDAQVGKLMEALDRLDLAKNTIVILLGDHGYHLGERAWWNKNTLYEFSCRAPLIIMLPQMNVRSQPTRRPVEFVDVFPTLMDYCGLEAPHELAGKSLRPLLEDPRAAWDKPALTQVQRGPIAGRAVRTERWRYIEWDEGRQGVELYDMEKDYGNYHNLAGRSELKDVMAQLKGYLPKDGRR